MAKVTIDGKEFEVQDGLTVLDACREVGIKIPHFCYHPKLSIAGNCRMCIVEIEKMPNLQPSCYIRVQDGMVVRTANDTVKTAREGILEFLLINHPLDCPICDQAGECPLQKNTMNYGPDRSRFEFDKVPAPKRVELGEHVMFDSERCIKCTRCIRFCDEITGTGELGLIQRSDHAEVDVFPGMTLDNDYSVNTVDICPVGALTNREYRFNNRVWFLREDESVCSECSRGCSMTQWINMKGEVVRNTPRRNDAVNETWMCDEGRLAFLHWNDEARLRQPALQNGKVEALGWDEALQKSGEALANTVKKHGAGSIGVLVSPYMSNEELYLASRLGGMLEVAAPAQGKGDDILKREDKSPNAKGAALIVKSGALSGGIQSGKIKALVAVKTSRCPELTINPAELKNLETLILIDTDAGKLAEAASVLLPACTCAEEDGSFTNEFGQVQKFTGQKLAPGAARPAWTSLLALGRSVAPEAFAFSSIPEIFKAMAGEVSAYSDMGYRELGPLGQKIKGGNAK